METKLNKYKLRVCPLSVGFAAHSTIRQRPLKTLPKLLILSGISGTPAITKSKEKDITPLLFLFFSRMFGEKRGEFF
jgi:hypothetical protein